MTLHQWWVHFTIWLRMFPTWGDHSWVSSLGEPEEDCFVCGAERIDPDWTPEDRERAQAFYRKNPGLAGEEE